MKHRVLEDLKEMETFQSEFGLRSSNPLTLEYLKSSKAIGYFKKDLLVGGYVINSNFPLRYFQWIPEDSPEKIKVLEKFTPGKTSEITCIWMNKEALSNWDRNRLYMSLTLDALKLGHKYIFGGSVTPKVAEIQKRVMPKRVYFGMTTLPQNPKGEIYFARSLELLIRTSFCLFYDGISALFKNVPSLRSSKKFFTRGKARN